ncbi:MAG: M48 family metallopeptidase [Chloroflexi bacterium]|nr:M48 family metallopeptidase [Chloroflexota bacterium]
MWEQIRSNRIRSVVLVIAMAGVLLVLGYVLGAAFIGSPIGGLAVALVIWGIMTLVAYFQGDSIFLAVSRARRIGPDDYPRLYNVVEEMKIASGLEYMPAVYIIDDPALNAFATGRDPKRASVAITSGLLEKLNRDELQGVIGHEMAHIKNRDVLLMTMCGVLLGTIVFLSYYASRMLFYAGAGRRSSGGGKGALPLIILAIFLMIVAPIAAQLIYFAISRKREYLADASSALYTRYPEGLASALEKISGSSVQLQTANKAMAPMYISNPFRKEGMGLSDLTSTHPPASERIRILRAMGGASYADYNTAYAKAHKGGGQALPASALAGVGAVGLRSASAEAAMPEPSKLERHREVSDLMWKQSNYRTIDCGCGTKLRIPPGVKEFTIQCPRCGRKHSV